MRYVDLVPSLAVVAVTALAAAVVGIVVRRSDGPAPVRRAVVLTLLAGAVAATLAVTLAPVETLGPASPAAGGRVANLVPLAGIRTTLRSGDVALILLNIGGNIALFLPVGFLTALAWRLARRRPLAGICVGVALSAAEELAQFVSGRAADVDDVLLNALGTTVGVFAALALAERVSGVTVPPARRRVTGR